MEKKRWLEKFTWDIVVEMNRQACEAGNTPHQTSSDGFDKARAIWEETVPQEKSFRDIVEICRLCHRLAPFNFYNGSVFTGIARTLSNDFGKNISSTKAFMFKSAIGHYVAGVIGGQALDDIFRRVVSSPVTK